MRAGNRIPGVSHLYKFIDIIRMDDRTNVFIGKLSLQYRLRRISLPQISVPAKNLLIQIIGPDRFPQHLCNDIGTMIIVCQFCLCLLSGCNIHDHA